MKEIDILLIFPRASPTSPQKNPALSIFYPGEATAKFGFRVAYWDERFDSLEDLYEKAKRARIFGVSSLSGFMLGRAIEILKWCKKEYPDKPTILGGVHATFLPENSLQESFVDFVVMCEGEERLPRLIQAINNNGISLEDIDGIGFKRNGLIIVNPPTKVINLEENYASPVSKRTERYFRIAAERNEVILPSSRGCPWACKKGCSFCSVHNQYLGTYRPVPFKYWSVDIDRIYQLHHFSFLELEDEDSAWLVKNLHLYADFLQKKNIKYHLHLRAEQLIKEEKVESLAKTGCKRIHIGVESGSERVRNKILTKGESDENFLLAAKNLAKFGIEAVYTYIIGNPNERPREIMETLRFSDRLMKIHHGRARSTIYILMALPGTPIFEEVKKLGWEIPLTIEEWSKVSAAMNPASPKWINNVYFIGGLHHNRSHKTRQNFPGLWRVLILPFEVLAELRWQLGVKTDSSIFFKAFSLENSLITRLMRWRSKRR